MTPRCVRLARPQGDLPQGRLQGSGGSGGGGRGGGGSGLSRQSDSDAMGAEAFPEELAGSSPAAQVRGRVNLAMALQAAWLCVRA